MSAVTLTGVSGASLGELLKGYGVIATFGSKHPDAVFWWDSALHLVIGSDLDQPEEQLRELLLGTLRVSLPKWANDIGLGFQKKRADKKKGVKGSDSPLKESATHDSFDPYLAEVASAVAIFAGGRVRSHPLFPGFGQDGSANYFKTLLAEADKLQKKENQNNSTDLEISLFGDKGGAVAKRLEGTGGLYFSGAIKRYATGLAWVHEKDAPSAVGIFCWRSAEHCCCGAPCGASAGRDAPTLRFHSSSGVRRSRLAASSSWSMRCIYLPGPPISRARWRNSKFKSGNSRHGLAVVISPLRRPISVERFRDEESREDSISFIASFSKGANPASGSQRSRRLRAAPRRSAKELQNFACSSRASMNRDGSTNSNSRTFRVTDAMNNSSSRLAVFTMRFTPVPTSLPPIVISTYSTLCGRRTGCSWTGRIPRASVRFRPCLPSAGNASWRRCSSCRRDALRGRSPQSVGTAGIQKRKGGGPQARGRLQARFFPSSTLELVKCRVECRPQISGPHPLARLPA